MHSCRRLSPLVLLLAVAAAGCAGSGAATPNAAPAGRPIPTAPVATPVVMGDDPDALHETVVDYAAAYLDGNGVAAWQLLSPRCQQKIGQEELTGLAQAAANLYGPELMESYQVARTGNPTLVTYTFPSAKLDQTAEPWLHTGAGWRNDDC